MSATRHRKHEDVESFSLLREQITRADVEEVVQPMDEADELAFQRVLRKRENRQAVAQFGRLSEAVTPEAVRAHVVPMDEADQAAFDRARWAREVSLEIGQQFIGLCRQAARDQNISHHEIAVAMGVSQSRVSNLFANPANLQLTTIVMLMDTLNVNFAVDHSQLARPQAVAVRRRG